MDFDFRFKAVHNTVGDNLIFADLLRTSQFFVRTRNIKPSRVQQRRECDGKNRVKMFEGETKRYRLEEIDQKAIA